MSKRNEHTFQFAAGAISAAATSEYDYHKERIAFWTEERTKAIEAAKEKGVEVREYPVTGGVRAEMVIDASLQGRINEASGKIHLHQSAADRFQVEAAAYATQLHTKVYELQPDDVLYFRLAGGPREI